MKLKNIFSVVIIISLFLSFNNCAKIGSPPGGEKDTIPPIPLKSSPANYATNYNQKKIRITFDEFIKLDNAFTEFTVSPPLEEKPLPLVRAKNILIDLPAQDLDSLTYTLDFGQAIEDNNERNKLPNFQFVISKMPHIDSFSVSGKVLDAYSKLPGEEQFFILLNNNLSDTAFKTVIPTYLGRTNPEGEFNINHIAPGTYNVFALQDANSNYKYDMPSEAIAFSLEPIVLNPDSFVYVPPMQDTLLAESTLSLTDSILFDSTQIDDLVIDSLADSTSIDSMDIMVYGYSFNLFSFIEAEPFDLYLEEYKRDEPEKFTLTFTEKMEKVPEVKLLAPDTTGTWYYLEENPTNDTLTYWLADSNLVSKDSILIEIIHPITDTLGELVTKTDTLLFRSKAKKEDKSKGKGGTGILSRLGVGEGEKDTVPAKAPVYRMKIKNNINQSEQDLHVPILLTTSAPVLEYNEELIELFIMRDTIENPARFTLSRDSSNFRQFRIHTEFEPTAQYRLKLHEGCFSDIYKRTIDSTVVNFTTQRDDFYGIINFELTNVIDPLIVELLNDKEKVLKTIHVDSAQKLSFEYMKPGKYILRVIYDLNENEKWDPGKYDELLLPEQVEYFPKLMEVRSNWEIEYSWVIPETVTDIRPKEDKTENEEVL